YCGSTVAGQRLWAFQEQERDADRSYVSVPAVINRTQCCPWPMRPLLDQWSVNNVDQTHRRRGLSSPVPVIGSQLHRVDQGSGNYRPIPPGTGLYRQVRSAWLEPAQRYLELF